MLEHSNTQLFAQISDIIEQSRLAVKHTVNIMFHQSVLFFDITSTPKYTSFKLMYGNFSTLSILINCIKTLKKEHNYGFKGHLLISHDGMINRFTFSPAHIDEREVVPELIENIQGFLGTNKGLICYKLKVYCLIK